MTSVLSPLAPAGAARDALTALLTATPRATPSAGKVESPRAVAPVPAANPAETVRNQTQRERPVGPPPSFDINVLQDIRTRLAEPAARTGPHDTTPAADSDEAEPVEKPEAPDRSEAAPRAVDAGTVGEPPHQLDKKV